MLSLNTYSIYTINKNNMMFLLSLAENKEKETCITPWHGKKKKKNKEKIRHMMISHALSPNQ